MVVIGGYVKEGLNNNIHPNNIYHTHPFIIYHHTTTYESTPPDTGHNFALYHHSFLPKLSAQS